MCLNGHHSWWTSTEAPVVFILLFVASVCQHVIYMTRSAIFLSLTLNPDTCMRKSAVTRLLFALASGGVQALHGPE